MADTVVFAYLVADLFHIGHLKCLEQAKQLGDYLIVGILTDEAVIAYKRKPIIPFSERIEIVRHIDCVDMAVKQDTLDPTDLLREYMPDIVVHGDDWGEDFPGAEYMRSVGKKAVRTRYYPYQSTTRIISEIRNR